MPPEKKRMLSPAILHGAIQSTRPERTPQLIHMGNGFSSLAFEMLRCGINMLLDLSTF